jgi:hypothetical protein
MQQNRIVSIVKVQYCLSATRFLMWLITFIHTTIIAQDRCGTRIVCLPTTSPPYIPIPEGRGFTALLDNQGYLPAFSPSHLIWVIF